jgi:PAS domain S-box-containing protein
MLHELPATDRSLSQREVQHQAVADLGRMALEGCTSELLFDRAIADLARSLDLRFVKLLELSPDRTHLTMRAGIGWQPGLVGRATVPADAGSQAGFTLLSEDTVVVADFRTERRFKAPGLLCDHAIRCGASVIVGPVHDPWGVLGVHESELGRCAFDRYDMDFVRSVANILWLHLRNLRIQREAERERLALRSFADAMPILFSVVDAQGRYEFVNEAYRTMGVHPDGLMGRHVSAVIGEAAYARAEPHMRRALDGDLVSFENRLAVQGEGERDVLVTFAPRRTDDGRTSGFYAAAVDISDQKRRQREILERTRQYRAIADSIPYGIWTCDAGGRLTYVSEAFLDLVGMTFEAAANFGWVSKLIPGSAEETERAWHDCVARRGDWEREHRFVGRDGRHYDILSIARPVLDEAGELLSYVGLNLDITERKRREETLALLSAELDHRVKNVFSLVITIARQASRGVESVDEFRSGFEGRMRALSAAHDMIAAAAGRACRSSRWSRPSLRPTGPRGGPTGRSRGRASSFPCRPCSRSSLRCTSLRPTRRSTGAAETRGPSRRHLDHCAGRRGDDPLGRTRHAGGRGAPDARLRVAHPRPGARDAARRHRRHRLPRHRIEGDGRASPGGRRPGLDPDARGRVEEVQRVGADREFHLVGQGMVGRGGRDDLDPLVGAVDEARRAQFLHIGEAQHDAARTRRQVLGPHPKRHLARAPVDPGRDPGRTEPDLAALHPRGQEVHRRRADEGRDEGRGRAAVDLERPALLFDPALVQHDQLVGHGHGLLLVVGDVDRGRAETLLQALDLAPHLDAQLGVEVRQRLVEEEGRRFAHDGAAHGHPLALPARQLARLAVEIVADFQDAGGLAHAAVDVVVGDLPVPQPVGEVPIDRHVRVKRVVLEHHRDVAVGRVEPVHHPLADRHVSMGDLLEPRDHAQERRLPAAGRPHQHHEGAVLDVGRDLVHGADVAVIDLRHPVDVNSCHARPYLSLSVRPLMNQLWKITTTSTGGSIAMMASAMASE